MDSSLNLHSIKMEKANAKLRYRRLQKITAIFRVMELCIFFFMVSRFTTTLHLPFFPFKLSGEYFFKATTTVLSPRFVFIVGNAIVIILFLKSGKDGGKNKLSGNGGDGGDDGDDGSCNEFDLYEEYVKRCEKNRSSVNVVVCTEVKQKQKKEKSSNSIVALAVAKHAGAAEGAHSDVRKMKTKIQRCQSEKFKAAAAVKVEEKEEEDGGGRKLRRSVTVRYRDNSVYLEEKRPPAAAATAEEVFRGGGRGEDEMSNEEFRRTIEAFIARQQRFLREED